MLERIIEFSLKQRLAVVFFSLAFAAFGVYAFTQLPIEAFPDVTDTQVQVITLFPGHAPEEVERQVTQPIEKELNGLPHLSAMRSVSMFGLSQISLIFEDGVGDYFARQQVTERLPQADLPQGVQPSLGPLATPVGELYRYTLVSEPVTVNKPEAPGGKETLPARSPMELRTIQDWTLERAFRQVDGVADVVSFGGFQKQFQVQVDPARLKSLGISLHQVFDALSNSNANAGGNYIQKGEEEYVVRGLGYLSSEEDIRRVVVAAKQGTPVTVGDVAHVEVGNVLRRGAVGKADPTSIEPDVVEGIVLMRKGEAPAKVLDAIHAKVDQLNADVLPRGVKIVPYYDRTDLVGITLRTVIHNLIEGALLVSLVLLLFLLSGRGALLVAAVIPLSLLSSFVYLHLRGMSANLLSMGAVDFGILVDGAVVIVENVFARMGHRKPEDSPDEVIKRATIEVAKPTLFSLAIIIVAYIPIFTLQRVEGRIFAPMANTVASALVGALVFSLTLVPVLSVIALRNVKERESPLVTWSLRAYAPALRWVLSHRWLTVAASLAALGASLLLMVKRVGSEFLPELNEGILWVTATMPPEISLEEAHHTVPRVLEVLRGFPEVRTVVSQLGRPEDGTDAKAVNNLEMLVDLKPMHQWTTAHTMEGLIDKMNEALKDRTLGIDFNFSMPIKDNVEENISGMKGMIAIKVVGDDLEKLAQISEEVRRSIADVPGIADLQVLQAGTLPQVQLEVNRDKISRYGLNIVDVQEAIETAIGGKISTDLWEGEKHFGVVVRFAEAFRNSVDKLHDIPVFTSDGTPIPLSELADIHVGKGRAAINREANQRFVGIKCNVRGRDMGGFVAEAQKRVRDHVKLPEGYQVTWGGEFENQQRAMQRLALVIPLSILLIFIILFQAFGSMKSAVIILANIPFALIGGVVGLYLTQTNLSVAAAVGFIALMGQAVLNGVLMVSQFNALMEKGLSVDDAVVQGAHGRLRAVLMTALLAALGLLPAAMSHEIGSETQRPLAIVVIGGLVSATILTLFVLPVIYRLATRNAPPRLADQNDNDGLAKAV
jgi:cobalt-zinc-cadmium resistance protein CzcA